MGLAPESFVLKAEVAATPLNLVRVILLGCLLYTSELPGETPGTVRYKAVVQDDGCLLYTSRCV